jgi:hypothetical protein
MSYKQRVQVCLLICFVALAAVAARSKPAYMERYNRDPLAKTELRSKCTVCHIGRGGAERNDFGEAFDDAGFRITPKLRAQFPDKFQRAPDEKH